MNEVKKHPPIYCSPHNRETPFSQGRSPSPNSMLVQPVLVCSSFFPIPRFSHRGPFNFTPIQNSYSHQTACTPSGQIPSRDADSSSVTHYLEAVYMDFSHERCQLLWSCDASRPSSSVLLHMFQKWSRVQLLRLSFKWVSGELCIMQLKCNSVSCRFQVTKAVARFHSAKPALAHLKKPPCSLRASSSNMK